MLPKVPKVSPSFSISQFYTLSLISRIGIEGLVEELRNKILLTLKSYNSAKYYTSTEANTGLEYTQMKQVFFR